jgi:hypothetical protein
MEPIRSGALSDHRQVDVLMLSDLRVPGGTSHSVVEEIAALAQAGWSTGLVHMNAVVDAIVRLRADPELRRRLGANGHQVALREHDWNRLSIDFVRVMDAIAAQVCDASPRERDPKPPFPSQDSQRLLEERI